MRFFDAVASMGFPQHRPNEPVTSDAHSREPTDFARSAVCSNACRFGHRSTSMAYSPPINSPFSATERFIRNTRSTSPRLRTANSQKTSK